jgi:hypothetical protein
MAPKRVWTYAPVGKRKYIDEKGNLIHNVSRKIDFRRIQEIEKKTILKASDFRKAHCPTCPDVKNRNCSGGYFSAVAPEICRQIAAIK